LPLFLKIIPRGLLYLCNMMKLFLLVCTLAVVSCNNSGDQQNNTSENDADAARNFIRSALDGKWNDARKMMIQDSTNLQLIDRAESMYQMMEREEKRSYRESTIRIYESRQLSDSITIVHYSNTFKNQKDSLKVVRGKGQWLIDLKYSLLPYDSLQYVQ
jgi:hypothetical protein